MSNDGQTKITDFFNTVSDNGQVGGVQTGRVDFNYRKYEIIKDNGVLTSCIATDMAAAIASVGGGRLTCCSRATQEEY